jgi:hypothetical protein
MAYIGHFDPSSVPPDEYTPIPAGEYLVQIVASDIKPNKSSEGRHIEFQLEVMEGPHAGRKIWDRLHHENQNETARKIAQQKLAQMVNVTNEWRTSRGNPVLRTLTNTDELHFAAMVAVVRVRQQEGYDPQNEVRAYKSAVKYTAAQPARPAAPTQPAPMAQAPVPQAPQYAPPQYAQPQQTAPVAAFAQGVAPQQPQAYAPQQAAPYQPQQQAAPAPLPWQR